MCWTAMADPPKKRSKKGLGRPRKVREPEVIVINPEETVETVSVTSTDGRSEEKLPQKAKRPYTEQQKKRVVVLASRESITVAV